MGIRKKPGNPGTLVMPLGIPAQTANDDATLADATLASQIDFDLAAETASFEAGRVSQLLAAGTLSLANLKPDALPRLLLRP